MSVILNCINGTRLPFVSWMFPIIFFSPGMTCMYELWIWLRILSIKGQKLKDNWVTTIAAPKLKFNFNYDCLKCRETDHKTKVFLKLVDKKPSK